MHTRGPTISASIEGDGQRLIINGPVALLSGLLEALRPTAPIASVDWRETHSGRSSTQEVSLELDS